jgi:hypothetical protein
MSDHIKAVLFLVAIAAGITSGAWALSSSVGLRVMAGLCAWFVLSVLCLAAWNLFSLGDY